MCHCLLVMSSRNVLKPVEATAVCTSVAAKHSFLADGRTHRSVGTVSFQSWHTQSSGRCQGLLLHSRGPLSSCAGNAMYKSALHTLGSQWATSTAMHHSQHCTGTSLLHCTNRRCDCSCVADSGSPPVRGVIILDLYIR